MSFMKSTSMGILPRKGSSRGWRGGLRAAVWFWAETFSQKLWPPPLPKMFWTSWQCGHRKPLMFSIRPSTRRPVFLVKSYSFDTSNSETACGVVTSTDERLGRSECPSTVVIVCVWWVRSGESCSRSDMCSSDVPGGVSMMSQSSSPQQTSTRN